MNTTGTPKIKGLLEAFGPGVLQDSDVRMLSALEDRFRFTDQQLRKTARWLVNCRMWDNKTFVRDLESSMLDLSAADIVLTSRQKRDKLFGLAESSYSKIRKSLKAYPLNGTEELLPSYRIHPKELKGRIFRTCQAFSQDTVCCRLQVLNIIDNCAMDCAYCILQNHYDDVSIGLPVNLGEKLRSLEIPGDQRMRIGTGEHSDSLFFENQNNILSDLCDFAAAHHNIILELKTKTDRVDYFLRHPVPKNVCCAWSLNTPAVILNEEHRTAPLERRLAAARTAADHGVKVGFHLHPMIYYEGWEEAYQSVIRDVLGLFRPEEVLWFSLGTVTLIKGLEDRMHRRFRRSRILQMDTEKTPDGKKQTYPFEIRKQLYRNALNALAPWKGNVFIYLCMEDSRMWNAVMGNSYDKDGELDAAINQSAFKKLGC